MTEDFHPVELAAHFLLSGSLDNLHENFQQLHDSQKILLTRLHLIETRLAAVSDNIANSIDLTDMQTRVRVLRRKLTDCAATIRRVEKNVDTLEN